MCPPKGLKPVDQPPVQHPVQAPAQAPAQVPAQAPADAQPDAADDEPYVFPDNPEVDWDLDNFDINRIKI